MRINRACGLRVAVLIVAGSTSLSSQGQRGQVVPTVGTALLAGQVIESPSGHPVPGATVALMGTRVSRSSQPVVADSQGRFFFADLPPGEYSTQVTKPGYSVATSATLSRRVELADGERVLDLKIRLVRLASLAGTVRDDSGDPVVGTGVIVVRRMLVNGRSILRPVGQNRTDDRGTYRVPNLQSGDYLVGAWGRDPIPFDGLLLTTLASEPMQLMGLAARALTVGADAATLDSTLRTFAPTFYPSSSTVRGATTVTLTSGEERSGVDLNVVAVRATRVSGTVVGAPSPVLASSIRLLLAGETDEGAALAPLIPVLVQSDGRFDFVDVPPGQYVLRVNHIVNGARSGGPSGPALAFLGAWGAAMGSLNGPQLDETPLWAAEPVTVGDEGVSGLTISLRRVTKISGRLQFVGAAPQPTTQVLSRTAIVVQPTHPDPQRSGGNGVGRVTPEATFQVPGVVPGRKYMISATAVAGWPTLKSVVLGGLDVTDLPIDIDASDVSDVVLTFTNTPMATLGGAMTEGSRAAADDVSVLVFPTDRRYWSEPGAASRRFRSSPIGHNGSFTVAALPSGEYFLVVVLDEVTAEWQETGRLEALSKQAQRVQLSEGDKKTVEVKR